MMINQERLVKTFLEMVRIDSPSGGEREIAEYVSDKFRGMGLDPQIDSLLNVIVKVDGEGKPLLINAHTDNVEPANRIEPLVEESRIRSGGNTVLGADDLAGVAAILEGVQSLVEDGVEHLPLEIAITSQEEVGLKGAKELDLSQFKAKEGVVLDSHGPVGEIILGSPTHNMINATVIGRAAHSGMVPEEGVDAIKIAAVAISQMKLGRIDKETTANIGCISGGSARNIVPERVEIQAEVRSRNPKKVERYTRAFRQALERTARPLSATVEIEVERAYNRYSFRKGDHAVKRVAEAIRQIGLKPRYAQSGGGSDANIFNAKKIKCVVTSVGYEQIHTTQEYLAIPELVKAAQLVVALATA
jgi:tripeptide aminopeptidase